MGPSDEPSTGPLQEEDGLTEGGDGPIGYNPADPNPADHPIAAPQPIHRDPIVGPQPSNDRFPPRGIQSIDPFPGGRGSLGPSGGLTNPHSTAPTPSAAPNPPATPTPSAAPTPSADPNRHDLPPSVPLGATYYGDPDRPGSGVYSADDPDPNNPGGTVTYDEDGTLLSRSDAEGNMTFYDRDHPGSIDVYRGGEHFSSTTVDESGNTTVRYLATDSQVAEMKANGGTEHDVVVSETKDALGQLISHTTADGHVTTFSTTAEGNPQSVETDPRTGAVTTEVSDRETGLPILHTLKDGDGYVTTYDPDHHRAYTKTDPAGTVVEKVESDGTKMTFDPGAVVRTFYDAHGKVVSEETHDDDGNLVRTTDGVTQVFDQSGNHLSTTTQDGSRTVFLHGGAGDPDPASPQSETYDRFGNLVQRDYPDGTITTFDPDHPGVTTINDPGGIVTTRTDDPDHAGASVTRDASGQVVSRTDTHGNTTTYDNKGGTSTTANPYGEVVGRTDQFGNSTTYDLDHGTSVTKDAEGNVTVRTETDVAGNVTTHNVKDGWTETKDRHGHVVSTTRPPGGTQRR